MSITLEQAQEKMRELEKRNKELEKRAIKAENSDQAKSSFLSFISHEMRGPVSGIIGFVQMLRMKSLDDEQKEIISVIESSSETLLGLINNMLDVEKYASGKMLFTQELFSLSSLLEKSVAPYKALAKQKSLDFIKNFKGTDVHLLGDEEKIRQLISNLLTNALKFTEKGSLFIKVGTLKSKEKKNKIKVLIEISDTGMGIDPKLTKSLFKPYVQANSKISGQFGGTGLGLTICKEIVSHYEGEIIVSSKEGKGTKVTSSLYMEYEKEAKLMHDNIRSTDIMIESTYMGHERHLIKTMDDVFETAAQKLMNKIHFDYDTCNDLIQIYYDQFKKGMQCILDDLDKEDDEEVKRKLHQLKGAAGALRMEIISNKLEQAEECMNKGRSDVVRQMLLLLKEQEYFH